METIDGIEVVRSRRKTVALTMKRDGTPLIRAPKGVPKAFIRQFLRQHPEWLEHCEQKKQALEAAGRYSEEEMKANHAGLPHGGFVIRTGKTGINGERTHTIEYRLNLDSNPEFTANVLVALARAVDRLQKRGQTGCKTIFDIAPADLSPLSGDELRAHML